MFMSMRQPTKLHNQQDGFASIVIALVLIIVLSLLTIGFAQLARHEQQNALSRQLANQAYYAAESGINDAIADINHGYLTAAFTSLHNTKAQCIQPSQLTPIPSGPPPQLSNDINTNNGVAYTCVLVDPDPPNLFKTLEPGQAWNTVFSTTGSSLLKSFDVSWDARGMSVPATVNEGFYKVSDWLTKNYPAVLEFTITPLSSYDRNQMIANTHTYYLYPRSGVSGKFDYATATGTIVEANCNGVNCQVTIDNLPSVSSGQSYLIHIVDYYQKSTPMLSNARTYVTNTQVDFSGSQYLIDATGKAHNVLKRLQVRVPKNSLPDLTNYAIEASSICKRIQTDPNSTTYLTTVDGQIIPACDLTVNP